MVAADHTPAEAHKVMRVSDGVVGVLEGAIDKHEDAILTAIIVIGKLMAHGRREPPDAEILDWINGAIVQAHRLERKDMEEAND